MEPQRSSSSPLKYNKVLILVIVVLVIVILLLLFKSPLPAPPIPPPGPPRVDREWVGKPGKMKNLKGTIQAYNSNPHLDVNSLQLKTTDGETTVVEFFPHTAQAVMQAAPIAAPVELAITTRPNDEAVVYRLVSIKNLNSGAEVVMRNLPPPPEVPGYNIENFNLKNPDVVTNNNGNIVALRKGDLFFHFKPRAVDDISGLIKSYHDFSLQAVRRGDHLGFVNIKHDKVYIVLSITINNNTFLVR